MEFYNYIKALHLIFVITWFAGLFYIVRLFVYHAEAKEKPEPEQSILIKQYQLMQYRLWYIITWPSAVLASIFAFWLLYLIPAWLEQDWMLVKLGFVVLLYAYQIKCHLIFKDLQKNEVKNSSNFFRLWNEGATLILFAVVFLVILKSAINWIYGVIGIFVFSMLIMIGFRFYKRIRERNK
ncbi:CopD family protein [Flavobacterium azooxidireducens]|uniref:Protoporphyrinogen IX oxidase n=1 Tax=Flavobacterium azooxidireducens TaxID=1871076 RepID=A0ABY4KM93_9FLAO|nr:CopD family protein [Flavobacterium azooxidireducens]UPQ80347.1 CopD family protein [Flavobacterium azooxidireducens]